MARRRSGHGMSQVCVFGVTCDANRPQEKKSVAGPANFADLRRKRLGPATKKGGTRDADGLEGEPYSNLDLGAGGA